MGGAQYRISRISLTGIRTANDNDALKPVIQKLDRLADQEQAERDAIKCLPFEIKNAPANHYLVQEGDVVTECCLLLSGYAYRHKKISNGDRQIVSFHIPGDILDLQQLLLSHADHNLQTVTDVTFASVPAADIKRLP